MCNDNDKIFCCTRLYQLIESYNKQDLVSTQTQLVVPILCRRVCPDECIETTFDVEKKYQYVTSILDNCTDCFAQTGCADNFAIYFNISNCELEEVAVSSLEEAENQVSENKILVDFIGCLSTPLSKADPVLYESLIKEQLSIHTECHKPCCYLLEDNTSGCIKISEFDCTKEVLSEKLNTDIAIVETFVSNENSCENSNCFDLPQNADINSYLDITKVGACCINNECLELKDVKIANLELYITHVLKLSNATEIIDSFIFNTESVSAEELCAALHGKFLGYDTTCNPSICLKNKIVVT